MTTDTQAAEEYPEAADDIAEMYAETFGGDTDISDLSDDVGMQVIRDASERCGRAGIPREERVDVIVAGARQFMTQQIEQDLQNMRWQLEMMFSI